MYLSGYNTICCTAILCWFLSCLCMINHFWGQQRVGILRPQIFGVHLAWHGDVTQESLSHFFFVSLLCVVESRPNLYSWMAERVAKYRERDKERESKRIGFRLRFFPQQSALLFCAVSCEAKRAQILCCYPAEQFVAVLAKIELPGKWIVGNWKI
jgi:hypothetical protein